MLTKLGTNMIELGNVFWKNMKKMKIGENFEILNILEIQVLFILRKETKFSKNQFGLD